MKKNKNIWKAISILIILIIFSKVGYEYYSKKSINDVKQPLIEKEIKSNSKQNHQNPKTIENQKRIITEEQIKEIPEPPNFYYKKSTNF